MMRRPQAAEDRIADDPRVYRGGREGALVLYLVGGVVLHPTEEAAWQVVQLLKQAIVNIAPIDDVEAARLHQAPPLSPLRPVAGCDCDIELFFRWVKCVLGCRHLLSQGLNGVRLQVYAAFIASLLINLWVGRAPTKRTYELLCFYLSGWATETELIAHIDRLYLKAPPPCKN